MKKLLLLILPAFIYCATFSQNNLYWQQQVNYTILVTLNDTAKTLDGYVSMQYSNNSPDTLHFIWFHLWPNAYKNDQTAFSDQFLENGRKDFYFSDEDKRGFINRLDFKVDKITAATEDHPQHQDIVKLLLPAPLPPHASVNIETPFHVKLPFNFSRGGYIGQSFQVTQWYPKPAVYDRKGWHEMPYLDQGEFYSDFGDFNVSITVPGAYKIAATGKLQSEETGNELKTLRYVQSDVHDFAWFADKDFEILHDTLQLPSKTIDVYAYYNKAGSKDWKNSLGYIKSAIVTKSNWLGKYPYDIVSVVERPGKGDGGMEYPTITLVSNPSDEKSLDLLINHEVGHNWFYGILASNERLHPWIDEGMNSYYDLRYQGVQYTQGKDTAGKRSVFFRNRIPDDMENVLLQSMIRVHKDQPVETRSEDFSFINYGVVAYTKTAQWMQLLEKELGKPMFDSIMQAYYQRWKFKHPYPEDFKAVAEELSGKDLASFFALLHARGSLAKPAKKKLKLMSFFSLKETDQYDHIFFAPGLGYNFYDKLMLGAVIHNYTLPPSALRFIAAPLYATGSKKINGLGRVSYSMYPGNNGQKLELSLAAATFTGDQFTDSANTKNYLSFTKIVPSLKFVFANKKPRSSFSAFIQWKTFMISETGLDFSRDTIRQTDIITYPKINRTLNQLQFSILNSRVLYPYTATFQAEQGAGFVRLNLTGNYFFNYAQGGGVNVRLFAGKFIYTGEKTFISRFETDRYHLNMSGAKGYEDYTYSNYFIGRNEFEGSSNQQMMIRDGAFKVRTDLLSDKIGKTDDWLTALNFTTTIPKQINPLELLPIKIPLRIFADIGTYAEAWKKNASTGRFLYDAGFQLSLLNNVVNVYFPVLYSKVYDDYFKSTITEKRFQKNISFSIDLQNITLKRLFPQSPF